MRLESKLALRYLVSSRLQTSLLVAGVAVGVLVFTFIAALMNGLGVRLTDNITGNVAHVTLEPERALPRTRLWPTTGLALYAIQPGHLDAAVIHMDRVAVDIATRMPGVRVVVPEMIGNATAARGDKLVAVVITGVAAEQASAIAPLHAAIVRGRLALDVGGAVVGSVLAHDLAIDVGDRVVLRATGTETVVVVRGVFTLGIQAVDERAIYLELGAAKQLFAIVDGSSQIELKVDDVWEARAIAARLARATGLKATSWLDRNTQLESGLRAQGSTAAMIKVFSLLTIAIGVASTLFLSVMRRRPEIGILRSFGIGRGAIVRAFILQGFLIGMAGALVGIALGFAFSHLLLAVSMQPNGVASIPIDPARGEYVRAVILATLASALAAILPAWSAAKTDPLEAIQA